MSPLIIIAVVLGVIVLYFVGIYNGLVVAKQKIKEAFADIDTMLKKRFDLIPNIVETVKGYAAHESKLFEDIAKYRAASVSGGTIEEKAEASNMLSGALKSLFAVAENYPELKANTNFLELQTTLNQVESDIKNSRRYYNGEVREFNNKIVVFPNNLIAGMLGFTEEKYFETKEEERQNVQVKF